jgi:putative transcriptional regulator
MEGSILKIARMQAGLSQEGLARICGISRETIRKIENNTLNPSIYICNKIAGSLGKSIDELFGDK